MDFFIALLQRPVLAKPYQRRQPSHDYLALECTLPLYYSAHYGKRMAVDALFK